jgi:VIT1/CCC1 family predicted Fe2+/Mn2+ transporter
LVLGISASGVSNHTVHVTGRPGLLAGTLSMGAGEYVSVRSQRERLAASTPDPQAGAAVPALDVVANELALVYRARGMSESDAANHATVVLGAQSDAPNPHLGTTSTESTKHEAIGTGLQAGLSSFSSLASGALIPVLPYLFGLQGVAALVVAAILVGVALVGTDVIVGCSRVVRRYAGGCVTAHRVWRRRRHLPTGSAAAHGVQLETPSPLTDPVSRHHINPAAPPTHRNEFRCTLFTHDGHVNPRMRRR